MPSPEAAARRDLERLVSKYDALSASQREEMTEASVVRQFIDILLRDVLGWPIEDPARYKYEHHTEVGRPDITLVPEAGGTIFLEAKRFGKIQQLREARFTVEGTITPGQLALPGMAVDRTEEEQQAINYAFGNGGTWAILTNFEKLRLFNARRDWLVLSFEKPSAYLDDFDLLWQLAYPNILNGSLDQLSNQRHTKDIDTDYLAFINEWRLKLAQNIIQRRTENPWAFLPDGTIDLPALRAVVQRFLDRLVIVRFAEDHLVIPPGTLRQFLELRRNNPYTHTLDQFLDQLFRRFDEYHNSALFAPGMADEASFSDDVLMPLIGKLYEARYRAMPADIMGNTYEQYLGTALALDDGSVTTRDNLETRKKQGSYYTPQYIVQFIVDRTLGRYLYGTANGRPEGEPIDGESRKGSHDIIDLRVLDGACGSGSFLIYAYQVLAEFYESEIERLRNERQQRALELAAAGVDPMRRELELVEYTAELNRIAEYPRLILETHLYGVDLDPQAAEIAVVNLIMRAMEGRGSRKRLPLILNQNIKVGNSLFGASVDDPGIEAESARLGELARLRKRLARSQHGPEYDRLLQSIDSLTNELREAYTGRLQRTSGMPTAVRPFHWLIEFPEAFFAEDGSRLANTGFRVVIGNPPYGASLTQEEMVYLAQKFDLGTTDTAALLMYRAEQLTSSDGWNGFIVPKSFAYSSTWNRLRDRLLPGLYELVDCGKVWGDVKLEQLIYVLRVNQDTATYHSSIRVDEKFASVGEITKNDCRVFGLYLNSVSAQEVEIAHKLRESGTFLHELVSNTRGVGIQNAVDENAAAIYRVIGGRNVQPFRIRGEIGWLSSVDGIGANGFVQPGSILVQNIVAHITRPVDHIKIIGAVIDKSNAANLVILDTVNQLTNTSAFSSRFLLGLLSSKLINWYVYRFLFGKAIRTMHFDSPITSRIPVPFTVVSSDQERGLRDSLVEVVATLEDEAASSSGQGENSQAYQQLDELVFALYDLTPKQIAVIEATTP